MVIEDDKEPILTREEFNPMTASNEKTLEIRSKSRETQKIPTEKGKSAFPPPRTPKKSGLKKVSASSRTVSSPKNRTETTTRPLLKQDSSKAGSVKKQSHPLPKSVKSPVAVLAVSQTKTKEKPALKGGTKSHPKTEAKPAAQIHERNQKKQKKLELAVSAPVKERTQSKKPPSDKPQGRSSLQTAKKGKAPVKLTSTKKKTSRAPLEFPTTRWGTDSIISFEATEHSPPLELTSIVGGFIFHEGKLVLANIPGRGWEIVGGRIDIGESPEDTFRREAMNQVGVTLSHIKMIGVVRIEHRGPEPPNCPYPYPIGYGVQFIGIVDRMHPFSGNEDSLGRSLISPEGFKEHYYDWNEYYEAVFNYAYSVYLKWRKKLKL